MYCKQWSWDILKENFDGNYDTVATFYLNTTCIICQGQQALHLWTTMAVSLRDRKHEWEPLLEKKDVWFYKLMGDGFDSNEKATVWD